MNLVDAIYTNHSGSMRLLEYFIRYVEKHGQLESYFFLFDRRLKSEVVSRVGRANYLFLKPSESARKVYYRNLPGNVKSIFCFGSVPPPISIKGRKVIILQHNLLFFESPGYKIHLKLFYLIKRLYIRLKCQENYQWLVQTPRVKDLLMKVLAVRSEKISVMPFFEVQQPLLNEQKNTHGGLGFIYPADGIAQKNHRFLFKVWEYLKENYGLLPELHLTIPAKFRLLIEEVERLRKRDLKIINHGFVSQAAVKELYSHHKFLLFPSLSESFGLPLIEGGHAGLRVIGSDLPFIYQVIKPSAVFDPHDVKGLGDIIVRLSNGLELPPTEVLVKDNISDVVRLIHSDLS